MNKELKKRNLEDLFLTKSGNFRKKDFALYVNNEDNLISIDKDFNRVNKVCIITLFFKDFNISFNCDIRKGTTSLNLENSKEILDCDNNFISKLFDNIYKECTVLRDSILDACNNISPFSEDEDRIIKQVIDENELQKYEFIYGKWNWWMKLDYKEFNIFLELESTGDHQWDLLCNCRNSSTNENGECIKCGEEGSRYVDGIESKIIKIVKNKTSFKFNKELEKAIISKFIESDLYNKLLDDADENMEFNEIGNTLRDHVYDNYL